MPALRQEEAQARSALVEVTSYDVALDLRDPVDTFSSRCVIAFRCRRPGVATFVDVRPVQLAEVRLNGRPVDPAGLVDGRLELTDLADENVLEVSGRFAYSRDGQGLHRSVDPADGQVYLYGMSFLDAAPQVFACFDQPDLKAPFDVRVTADPDWIVAGNGRAEQTAPGQWSLATTPPLSTYFWTVCAGPYASVTREHDGIRLAVHARASMAEQLRDQADDLLDVTARSFDYYHRLFGIRYPWGDYHQFFVPEFNAGAMENPGCVVFRDQYIFRGRPTRGELLSRASVIAHEMAHQWFGNLVTMQWWDDLWLNESFAEYMGYRTSVEANGYDDGWAQLGIERKTWGYAEDRGPATHPVAGSDAGDSATALTNFDGISYAKGASVLRQLVAWLGDDVFLAGVRDHLGAHAYGNATLADFLAAMERASGRDLTQWSQAWLRTSGADTLGVERGEGTADLRRTEPSEPADRVHVLDVAAFAGGREVARIPVTLTGAGTPLPGLPAGEVIVVPNAADLTWAQLELDPGTLALLADGLAGVPDLVAREVIWSAVIEGVAQAKIDPRLGLAMFAAAWPGEPSDVLASTVGSYARQLFAGAYLPVGERAAAVQTITDAAQQRLDRLAPDDPATISAARLLAATTTDLSLLGSWRDGQQLPPALTGDRDIRWSAVHRLAVLGAADEADIDALRAGDDTLTGALAALAARSVIPQPAAKQQAWEALTGGGLSNYEAVQVARGFFSVGGPQDLELVAPYVERFFVEVPALREAYGEFALAGVVSAGFPAAVTVPTTLAHAQAALDSSDLTPGARRRVLQGTAILRDALTAHERFAPVSDD